MSQGVHRSPSHTRPAWVAITHLVLWTAGSLVLATGAIRSLLEADLLGMPFIIAAVAMALTCFAGVVGLFFLIGFAWKAADYLLDRHGPVARVDSDPAAAPSIAILYLTAGDFDPVAVDSLLRLDYPGPRMFVLHDDGTDPVARRRMETFLESHPCRVSWEVAVWHRQERTGGKAGAVNAAIARLDSKWQLILLCDSDSIALEADALVHSVHEFEDSEVAVVQFRNVGYADGDLPALARRLARSVDVFDAMAKPMSRWGYLPFFGHNAILRAADVRRAGGLTPGYFSDDLDLSIRLTLAGKRIVYRGDIAFAERCPGDWAGFRKRARKWAFGCMQVVRSRTLAVLTTPGVPFAQRVGMLEFMSFYPAQLILIAGLGAAHCVLPFLLPPSTPSPTHLVAGVAVLAALFAPTIAWAIRHGALKEWPALAWTCAMVYGGSILPTARGVLDGLSTRPRPWIPSNLRTRRPAVPADAWIDAAAGLALVLIPYAFRSEVLAFPFTYVFVATLLFSPLVAAAYREKEDVAPPREALDLLTRGAAGVLVCAGPGAAAVLGFGVMLLGAEPVQAAPRAEAHGDQVLVDGKPFDVRGIHYSPWLPHTGPGTGPYPPPDRVARDLREIRRLGATLVLVHDCPAWVLDEVDRQGLVALHAFSIGWNDTSAAVFEAQAVTILSALDTLRRSRAVIGWILGNEVPVWVGQQLGAETVSRRLASLASRVRQRDPDRLITHANWPPMKHLDLSFADLVCFNLYPAWPYEVAVRGFGPYLREVLLPLATGRPLLVSEFGINSLEAGEERQAEVLAECWREIEASAAIGGVVFEWCDEWWKNWDNPITGSDFWQRAYAPDDAQRHDADPEEHYGIVRSDRSPKPALAAVRAMWGQPRAGWPAWVPASVLASLALLTWLLFRPRRASRRRAAEGAVVSAILVLTMSAGSVGASVWTIADTLDGLSEHDQFGSALALVQRGASTGVTDTSRNALAAIGARFEDVGAWTAAGTVRLFRHESSGPAFAGRLDGLSADEHFGESAIGGGDVDGDGVGDLVVGAPLRNTSAGSASGAVDVFLGSGLLEGRSSISGEASNDWFGQSVALGDLDGDGRAEIIVGAPYNDRAASAAGAVFVYRFTAPSGYAIWHVLTGTQSNEHFGWSVAYLGDFDGDGFGDLAAGGRLWGVGTSASAGRVGVFFGGPGMDAIPDRIWSGEARDDWFGNSVAGPGDLDGDGRADLLVGAPYNDRGGSASGAAYVFRGGAASGSAPVVVYEGESPNAQMGWVVGAHGDVDGDGRPDAIVGARMQATPSGVAAGRVYVFGGAASPSAVPIATADGEQPDDWFGNTVGLWPGYFVEGLAAVAAGSQNHDGNGVGAGRVYALGQSGRTSVLHGRALPHRLRLAPNPARSRVQITGLAPGPRTVDILDARGRVIRTLAIDGVAAEWDGADGRGHRVAPGLYFMAERALPGQLRVVGRVVLIE